MQCFISHLGSAIQLSLLLWILIIFFKFCLWKTLQCNLDHAYILQQNANAIWVLKSSIVIGFAHGQGYNAMFFKDKTGEIFPKLKATMSWMIQYLAIIFRMFRIFLKMATIILRGKEKGLFRYFLLLLLWSWEHGWQYNLGHENWWCRGS